MVRITIDIDDDGATTGSATTADTGASGGGTPTDAPKRLSQIDVERVISAGPAPEGGDSTPPADSSGDNVDHGGTTSGQNAGAAPA